MKIEIYVDGACSGNPGPGGYGLVVLKDNNIIKYRKSEFCDIIFHKETKGGSNCGL